MTTTLGETLLLRDPIRIETPMSWGPCLRGDLRDRRGYWTEGDVRLDHIRSMEPELVLEGVGGDDDPSNLQVAHAHCNLRKGARAA